MALDFTGDPYYDDFDPTKNFHRILFKPGYAVQARELTQSQTILQDQISKFGTGVFQDGSKVSGGNITVDTNVITCKLSTDATTVISNLVGLFAVGQTSNFIAQVNSVDVPNLYISTKPVNTANKISFSSGETINFYNTKIEALASLNSTVTAAYTVTAKSTNIITRNSTGTYLSPTLNISTGNINVGDTITITSINFSATVIDIIDANSLTLNNPLIKDVSSATTQITNQISVRALEVNIDDGVWFTNGFFVANYKSSIVPNSLTIYPSSVVGFEVDEFTVDAASDASLLDPAIGASNYQAPGADRYKISLNLVVKPYVNDQTVTNLTTNKFIELVRINAGTVEDINSVPILSDVSAAIATAVSDISGDFIVNPFSLLIGSTSNAQSELISSSISAGKAYLGGYPIQHISQTPYYLQKARSTNVLFDQDIETYYGDYTRVKNLNGSIIDFQTSPVVELHNVAFGAASTSTKIGTARVRNFSYDSGNLSTTEYKAFLFDINLTNNVFANVASIILPNGSNYSTPLFSANTVSPVTLVDNTYNSLIFPLPQTNISNVSSVNYVTTRKYSSQTFASGIGVVTASTGNEIFQGGSGTISSSVAQQNFIVVTKSASGGYPAGHFVPMDQSNVSVTITNSPGTPQASINIAGNFTGTADVYAVISVTNDTQQTKLLHTNYAVQVSANTTLTAIDLGKSDIYNFRGVYELGNTHNYLGAWSNTTSYSTNDSVIYDDGVVYISLANSNSNHQPNTATSSWSSVTNNLINYTADNGQKDAYYDHGTITNVSGVSKGNVVAVFDYFTHSGGSGYFSVNSYPVNYINIPSFTSPQYGTTYSLRDVLDFRPRRTDNNTTFDSYQLPAPFNNAFVNYGYYLNRIDKIVLYPNGQFKTITGTPAYTNPVAPSDVPGTLTIFTIYFPAYTYTKDSIQVTPTNLRRYTMRDVGLLDKRISTLESYTSLSILENQVTGSDVTDSTGLNLLFKNGYLVDGFTGSGVADVRNPDYAASIDGVAQIARPPHFSNVASYFVDTNQGAFVNPISPTTGKTNDKLTLKNNIVTFSYDETSLVVQEVASEVIDVNPFNVISFTGAVTLSPSSDVWYSTQTQPNINIVTDDQSAWVAAVGGTGNGSQWNDWQLNWTGQPTDTVISSADQASITRDTTAITNAIQSQGLTSAVNGGPIQVSSTTQILSNAVIPYARSIPVHFTINGLAPFTQIHTFLNGSGVDRYVTPDVGYTDTINYITIVNPGSGYTDGNYLPIINIVGPSDIQAVATANVSGGQIVAINFTRFGSGYRSIPTIQVTGSNLSPAVLTANGAGYLGGNLVTDINGTAEGTITIPNNQYLNIPTGTILVEFGDNIITPSISNVYARTTFVSQGTLQTTQTTVVSTRPPIATSKPQVVERTQVRCTGNNYTPVVPSGITVSSDGAASVGGGGGAVPVITYETGGWGVNNPQTTNIPVGGSQATAYVDSVAQSYGWSPTNVCVAADVAATVTGIDTSLGNVFGASVPACVGMQAVNAVAATTASTGCFGGALLSVICYIDNHTSDQVAAAAAYLSDNPGDVTGAAAAGNAVDPVSQNFYVDATKYPNGVFLSSVDLFFATVDATIPVNVRIRPTVNGYPDAVNDIPGSIVWKNPSQVNIPDPASITNGIGPATTFTFDHPVYLQPGQYSIMVAANSNAYTMYASKLGQVQYGTNYVINAINYAASLFKSQNSSTWIPAPGETLCFNLKICDFAGGSTTFKVTSNASPTAIQYDLMQLINSDLSFNSLDSINYNVTPKDFTTSANNVVYPLLPGQTHQFPTRQIQSSQNDIVIQPTLTNIDRWTSPVVDLERLNTILVKNIITPYVTNGTPPYYSANTASEVMGGFGQGNAAAKYITRRVTLNNNFASTGITVYVDVNRQPGTKIEVYCKVQNQYDKNNFDNQPYILMSPILTPGSGLPVTGATDYVSDTYQSLNITYNDIVTGTTYTNFNVFAIKVVFYSDNPAIAPQIKNFRAVATA